MPLWDDETTGRLRQMVANGDRPSKIAKALDCSRNAIIGKMLRIGIKSHYNRANTIGIKGLYHSRKRSKLASKKQEPKSTFNFRSAIPKEPTQPIPVNAAAYAGDVARCSIFELSDRKCKWPIGDPSKSGFGFCGLDKSPDSGSPYCPEHTIRSYA